MCGQWVGNGQASTDGKGCGKAKSNLAVGRIFNIMGWRMVKPVGIYTNISGQRVEQYHHRKGWAWLSTAVATVGSSGNGAACRQGGWKRKEEFQAGQRQQAGLAGRSAGAHNCCAFALLHLPGTLGSSQAAWVTHG